MRFRPRLDPLGERALPDAGVEPPPEPAAEPSPGETAIPEVELGEPVYVVDESGATTAVWVGNSDGSLTTTVRDGASPTGWTAVTPAANGGAERVAAAPPQENPVPGIYAVIGGAGGASLGGVIKIAGGAQNGGATITWTSHPNGGFTVAVVAAFAGGLTFTYNYRPDGSCVLVGPNGSIEFPAPPPPQ